MKPPCLTLINYLKHMKKLSKIIIVLFGAFLFQCCTEPAPYPVYYQIKNETGSDVFIKFYYSEYGSGMKEYESINLKNNESSEIFKAMLGGGIGNKDIFILYSDSIDIYLNNLFVKRYKSPYIENQEFSKKTLYNDLDFSTIIKSEKGYDVHVYKMLKSDFE